MSLSRHISIVRIAAMLCTVLHVLVFPAASAAATHFVDWSTGNDANDGTSKTSPWKRAPGMNGFAGNYVHQPGDHFIFKGGVVWPASALPFEIIGSGSARNPDIYTSDESWFAGAEWTLPLIDGGGSGTQLVHATAKHFITIDGLALTNMDRPGANTGYAIHFENCGDIALTNNRIQPYCWRAIYFVGYDGKTQGNILIHNNDISETGVPISIASAMNGDLTTIIDKVEISGNKIHDLTSMIVNTVHGDGIQIWSTPGPNTNPSVSGSIHNNSFYGSVAGSGGGAMTAWIYIAGANGDFLIYNNVLGYSEVPTTENLFEALISVRDNRRGSTQIYNNTLTGTTPGMSAAILVENSQNVTVQNNILRGMQFSYYLRGVAGFYSDYNLMDTTAGLGSLDGIWQDYPTWQAAGNDVHVSVGDPKLAAAPNAPYLEAGSPAAGTGVNLSTVFTMDRDGKTRTIPWDKGAYVSGIPAVDADNDGLPDSWELTFWRSTSNHGPLDDDDNDGYPEILEYALGLDPTVPNPPGVPAVVLEAGYLTIAITKQSGIVYEVESSANMAPGSFNAGNTTVMIDDATTLKVRDNEPIGTQPSRFLRLKVSAAPRAAGSAQ